MKFNELKYSRINVNDVINTYNDAIIKIKKATCVTDVINARNTILDNEILLSTNFNLAFMRWSINTVDEFYLAEKDYYDNNIPLLNDYSVQYKKALLNSPFLEQIKGYIPEILLEVYKYDILSGDSRTEKLCIEENNLVSEYSNLMSSMLVEYEGNKVPITIIKKYMCDGDRTVRKNAFNAFGKAMLDNREKIENIFDLLVKNRNEQAIKLGNTSFVELGYYKMNRVAYSIEDIHKLRENIIKYIVPFNNKIRLDIAKKLKIDQLKLYDNDNFFDNFDPKPVKNDKELIELGRKMYHNMSTETGKFIDEMIDNDMIDYMSKENKWGGGYEESLPLYNSQFILANFNGTSNDADVLTHECGHAFASYEMFKSKKDKELGLPFMDVAECHSMSMEFFCWKFLDEIFGKDTDNYKYKHLISCITFLPYGTMVDNFQEDVYLNTNLTIKERNDLWNKLEKIYRPYMDADGIEFFEEGTRWQYQMHIFENPFYYIDYVLAQIVALEFLIMSLEDYDKAFNKYLEFISYGADLGFKKIIEKCNLLSPFDDNTFIIIVDKLQKIIDNM